MPKDEQSHINSALLDRYFARDATAIEQSLVERWLSSPAGRLFAEEVRAQGAFDLAYRDGVTFDFGAVRARIERETIAGEPTMPSERQAMRSAKPFGMPRSAMPARFGGMLRLGAYLGVGAAVATIALMGGRTLIAPKASAPERVYSTAPGQQSSVSLSDGSTITLAPGTTIRVADNNVTVAGEAYFSVAPNAKRPLTVHTDNAVVRVLGTKFTVRNYATDRVSRVVVEEGKVSLQPAGQTARGYAPRVLTVRMLGQASDSSVTVQSGIALDDYTGWTRGRLVFTDVPLRDVVTELARAYGAEIQITDSALAQQPMTMSASIRQEPLTRVLENIGRVANAHYAHVDGAFVILPGRAASLKRRTNPFKKPEQTYGR